MARPLLVIANWKMYKTAREAADYIERFIPLVQGCKAKLFLAVPFTSIAPTARYAKTMAIQVGAQNMHDAREGAFTGEIAALMLKEAGASFVLLGHSERRHLFHESDELIHRKVVRALQDDVLPVLCVGETRTERDAGEMESVLERQISSALEGIATEEAARVIIAYEPVWAIGTGIPATAPLVGQAHHACRHILTKLLGKSPAQRIPILYGGSVQPDNAGELSAEKDVDGVLVGGASLDPEKISQIVWALEAGCPTPKKRKRTLDTEPT